MFLNKRNSGILEGIFSKKKKDVVPVVALIDEGTDIGGVSTPVGGFKKIEGVVCPECGSTDVEESEKDFYCNTCGYEWEKGIMESYSGMVAVPRGEGLYGDIDWALNTLFGTGNGIDVLETKKGVVVSIVMVGKRNNEGFSKYLKSMNCEETDKRGYGKLKENEIAFRTDNAGDIVALLKDLNKKTGKLKGKVSYKPETEEPISEGIYVKGKKYSSDDKTFTFIVKKINRDKTLLIHDIEQGTDYNVEVGDLDLMNPEIIKEGSDVVPVTESGKGVMGENRVHRYLVYKESNFHYNVVDYDVFILQYRKLSPNSLPGFEVMKGTEGLKYSNTESEVVVQIEVDKFKKYSVSDFNSASNIDNELMNFEEAFDVVRYYLDKMSGNKNLYAVVNKKYGFEKPLKDTEFKK